MVLLATEIGGLWIAAITVSGVVFAALIAATSPLILARQIEKQSIAKEHREIVRQEAVAEEALRQQAEVAEETRRRQQEVADQVTETARILQERQDVIDLAHGRDTRLAAEAQAKMVDQLSRIKVVTDQTHVLVNSNWIAELTKSIVSLKAQLVFARRLIAMTKEAGQSTEPEDTKAIAALEETIRTSEATLAQLVKDTETANAIAAAAAKEGPQNVLIVNDDPVDVSIAEKKD